MNLTKKITIWVCVVTMTMPCLARWEFNKDGDLEGWTPGGNVSKLRAKDGLLTVSVAANTNDPWIRAKPNVDGSQYPGVYARMRWSTDATDFNGARFFFKPAGEPWKNIPIKNQVPTPDQGFKTVIIPTEHPDFPHSEAWNKPLQFIRFDMMDNVPVDYTVDFDWVRLAGEYLDNESLEFWDDVNDSIAGWTISDSNVVNFDVSEPNFIHSGEWAASVTGTGTAQTLMQYIKGGLDLSKGQRLALETALLIPDAAKDAQIIVHIAEQGQDGQWTEGSPIEITTLGSYFIATSEATLELEPSDRTGLRAVISITSAADTQVYVDETLIALLPEVDPYPDKARGWPINCVMLSEGQEITIDGVVSAEEYAGAQAVVINKDTARALDPFDPNYVHDMIATNDNMFTSDLEDYSGTYYVMWDVNNFYIACSIQDDSYNFVGPLPNQSDSLQFTLTETAFEQEKGMMYIPTIAPADDSGNVFANNVFNANYIEYDLFQHPEVEYAGAVDEATQDWTVELKIPWWALVGDFRNDIFKPYPALGLQVGFNIVVGDFDPAADGTAQLEIRACTHPGAFPWQITQDQTSEILTFVDADGKVPAGQ